MSAFHRRIESALRDAQLQQALRHTLSSFEPARRQAWATLPNPAQVRAQANAIRARTIANLDHYLHQFTERVSARGGKVYFARTAEDACRYVVELARQHGVRLVAKSKSMVSEEIELNARLEQEGIRVVETDLGEYIVQLAGERPSHIITPAIHKRRQEIAQILHQHLGMPLTDDIAVMTATARDALREVFLQADIGITGVNFGIAETGTLVFVSNEGNARMVSTLPRLHVALMGVERLVPTWEECELLLRVLARSATGQKLTVYTSFVSGPKLPGEWDGPEELHVVIVDNGRLRWRGTPMEQALYCIRCGACLNVCPVYKAIGGHAYQSVYPGPIGSLVTPMLWGKERADLAYASTLCGACSEVCPVGIPIHDLLVRWRAMASHRHLRVGERWALRLFGWIARHPRLWRIAQRLGIQFLARRANNGWIERGFGPLKGWTATRSLIAPQVKVPIPPSPFSSWEKGGSDTLLPPDRGTQYRFSFYQFIHIFRQAISPLLKVPPVNGGNRGKLVVPPVNGGNRGKLVVPPVNGGNRGKLVVPPASGGNLQEGGETLAGESVFASESKPIVCTPVSPLPLGEGQGVRANAREGHTHGQDARATGTDILCSWEAVGVRAVACRSEEVVEQILRILGESNATCVLIEEAVLRQWTGLAEQLAKANIQLLPANADKRVKATAQVGISLAVAGWADTGSVVITTGEGRLRSASLLPPISVLLVPNSIIFPSASEWLPHLRKQGVLRTMVAITGPSRTADIEKTLTIGVHGPGMVYALLIEDC